MAVKPLDGLILNGKRVLVRVDYNVPLNEKGQITDDSRIKASLPTLNQLRARGCKITLMSHLGRPKGQVQLAFSLAPVAVRLGELLGMEVPLVSNWSDGRNHGEVQVLENLRFHVGETKNDEAFARGLAAYGEVFVNDAFGAAHRAHASTQAITRFFEQKGAGLLMMKELRYLKDALKGPKRPFLAILGGSKISDKLKLIENLLGNVDQLMIGGGMSYTFLSAQGVDVGNSLVEKEFLAEAKRLIDLCQERGVALLLPLDHLTGDAFSENAQIRITQGPEIESGEMGLDIGPETIHVFLTAIKRAKTIVWNGPMGVFEWDAFAAGTLSVAEAMAEADALTIVGGGDSVAAISKAGVQERIDHISTGGGASLELLGGHELPGISALEQ